jgi:hypothetical protein
LPNTLERTNIRDPWVKLYTIDYSFGHLSWIQQIHIYGAIVEDFFLKTHFYWPNMFEKQIFVILDSSSIQLASFLVIFPGFNKYNILQKNSKTLAFFFIKPNISAIVFLILINELCKTINCAHNVKFWKQKTKKCTLYRAFTKKLRYLIDDTSITTNSALWLVKKHFTPYQNSRIYTFDYSFDSIYTRR